VVLLQRDPPEDDGSGGAVRPTPKVGLEGQIVNNADGMLKQASIDQHVRSPVVS
jgi:hypothetical protein